MAEQQGPLEDIYREKISLFEDLLSCIKSERDNLITLNIENLWALMEEKQKIMEAIDDAHGRIGTVQKDTDDAHETSAKDRRGLQDLNKKLASLKEEIRVRVKENVSFIRETLGFFDEIISSFVKAGSAEASYYPFRRKQNEPSTLIYHREV